MRETLSHLENVPFPTIKRDLLTTLQVNLGYRCNQSCLHCHVNAGPKRTESMTKDTVDHVLAYLDRTPSITTLDLTGGAPELNPHFRYGVEQAIQRNIQVIDRCNLTILEEPGQNDLAEFLAQYRVQIVASLPCYLEDNVDQQRGDGVFQSSLRGLKMLNDLGYGKKDTELTLNLVYNPQGPTLPPPQTELEIAYKKHLKEHYGIVFNQLFTLTNLPVKRFGSALLSNNRFEDYMTLLKDSYNAETLKSVMCRNTLSVDWQGFLYDCDFNQMLDLPLPLGGRSRTHISELNAALNGNPIVTRGHCYGCTAGQGSSCGGALN